MKASLMAVLAASTFVAAGSVLTGGVASAQTGAETTSVVSATGNSCWVVTWTPWYRKGIVYGGGSVKCSARASLLTHQGVIYRAGHKNTSGKNCRNANYCASWPGLHDHRGNQTWCSDSYGWKNGMPLPYVWTKCEHYGW